MLEELGNIASSGLTIKDMITSVAQVHLFVRQRMRGSHPSIYSHQQVCTSTYTAGTHDPYVGQAPPAALV